MAILVMLTVTGCARVEFATTPTGEAQMTTNTQLRAKYSRAADGAETWELDTASFGLVAKLRVALADSWNWLTRALDDPGISAGE